MNRFSRIIPMVLVACAAVLLLSGSPASATLSSQFLGNDQNALQIMAGTPYNMNDPAWRVNYNQNRNIFAYKLFAGLLMLGYQTEMGYNYGLDDQHLRALKAFQAHNGLMQSTLVDSVCLQLMDQQLVQREQQLAPVAQGFPLYDHMQQLHPNDISRDTLAAIYTLPISVLPQYLRMSADESLQCIAGQCDGFIHDANGGNISSWPTLIDPVSEYYFVGAYFDPFISNARLPSAVEHVDTVLHEYAHYLDGTMPWMNLDPARQLNLGRINTSGFYKILYDMQNGSNGCYPKKSSDPQDWITKYGYHPGYGGCAGQQDVVYEEWAEAFSMYVAAGKDFRAAALHSALVAQQYDWLKVNVFNGQEFDTDLPRGLESGCNDVHGTAAAQPGYAHCNDNYIWNFTLPYRQGAVPNDTPEPFAFAPQTGVNTNTATVSDQIVVSGINTAAPVTIVNGEFSVNGGSYGSTAAWVNNGDAITIRQSSSSSLAATTVATLMIGGVSASFSVTTEQAATPTIDGTPPATATIGVAYSFIPTATNATSFTITNKPAWATFNIATGKLSGTPNNVVADYGNIVITAVNNNGTAALPAFSISVKLAPPTITIYPDANAVVGTSYGFYVWATNADSLAVSNNLPPGITLDTSTSPASFGGIPTTPGVYANIVISATNSGGTTQLPPFTITVRLPTPTITGDPATVTVMGTAYPSFTPTATYTTSFSLSGTLPQGMSFDPATGTLNGTSTTAGTYGNIVMTAVNDEGTAQLPAFTITVFPGTNSFTAGGSMAVSRQFHAATLLQNGKVLVTGGIDTYGGILVGAELYDPATDSWSAAGSMAEARAGHTATLLPNGSVLVAGGYDNDYNVLSSVELYDPATNSWSPAAPMAGTRAGHAATVLTNGKVLVLGGVDTDFFLLASAEVYDPITDSWNPTPLMAEARYDFTVTLLASGKVLAAGGSGTTNAELYDPASNSWTSGGAMLAARYTHTATLLSDGKVLVAGGYEERDYLASAELYDPSANSWSAAGSMAAARQYHSSTLLGNGMVLVAGGSDVNNGFLSIFELYDSATGTWSAAGSMTSPRRSHTATLLQGGTVLVAGGIDGTTSLSSTELYASPVDTTPDLFAFAPRTGVNLTTVVESGPVVVTGINAAAAVSISSGEYAVSVDGGSTWGSWSGTAGTVNVNNWIKARQTSSSQPLITSSAVLTIGGVSGSFDVTTAGLPGAPSIGSVSGGNGQATVSFSVPQSNGGSAVTGYTVTSSPAGGVDSNAGTTATSHTVTGLVNGTPYTFTVTATNGAGTGPASAASGSVTPATVPGAPSVASVVAGNGQATVTFAAPLSNGGSAVTGYTVSSNPPGGVDSNAGTTANTHTITGLTNGTPYTLTVTATNGVGTGAASAPSGSVTPATIPGAPTITSVVAGNARAVVSFTPPLSNGGSAVAGYTVASSPAGGVDVNAGTTATTHTITGLTNGTPYTFTVTATNGVGTGPASAASASVKPAAVTTPTAVIAAASRPASPSNLASGQIAFNGANAASFQCRMDGGSYAPCSSPYDYSSLSNGSHTFSVRSFNADMPPRQSTVASYTWTVDTTPPTISGFTVAANTNRLTVPVSFAVSGIGSGLAGYLVTESGTPPLAGSAGWAATKPASYTATTAGAKTLYAWVKDRAGNVSAAGPGTSGTVNIDTTKPVVTGFLLTSARRNAAVPVAAFTATDDLSGVAKFLITTTATKPSATATGWRTQVPATGPAFTAAGSKTLYAWVMDRAGNISAARSATVVITP